ncbi:uncharacterized protein TrAFT101_010454 [Trichoderma asperellum]|uniref:uncharacterized protein n=1 Tax=Trichoderma asperellum TaxID=101201 RepID=UPI003319694C|nr:hypothetical protein TrAFT101_010454 [Trichoderma asperellum]
MQRVMQCRLWLPLMRSLFTERIGDAYIAKWKAIIDIQISIGGMERIQNHIYEMSIPPFLQHKTRLTLIYLQTMAPCRIIFQLL